MKKKLSILLILAIIGVGFLILNNRKREATQFADPAKMETPVAPKVGYKAPDFKLLDVQGNTVTLSQYLGKPVVVNFWATWCISVWKKRLSSRRIIEITPTKWSFWRLILVRMRQV